MPAVALVFVRTQSIWPVMTQVRLSIGLLHARFSRAVLSA